jgi:cell division protein FtsW
MSRNSARIDRPLIILLAVLIFGGCMIFASAAFGLLARGATHTSSVVFNHLVLGVGLGLVALVTCTVIELKMWRRYAPYLFALALIATCLVFIPGLGTEHGGGKRWIILFGTSFQPSELLKVGTVIMAAAYFAAIKHRVSTMQYGLGGFLGIMAAPVLLMLLQPDMGTLGIIGLGAFSIYVAAGASWRDIAIVILIGLLSLSVLAIARPYVRERVVTFFDPSHAQHDQGYQIKQSLIAVGSGGFAGRGFGQGIQKFTYLPEPMGDSIFAVAAEELGFIGSVVIIALFVSFALRGLIVSARAADPFTAYLGVGIVSYLSAEAFINIAAMLGMAPLTGVPLTFVSQGGSAMLVSLASAGILLAVSKNRSLSTRA